MPIFESADESTPDYADGLQSSICGGVLLWVISRCDGLDPLTFQRFTHDLDYSIGGRSSVPHSVLPEVVAVVIVMAVVIVVVVAVEVLIGKAE